MSRIEERLDKLRTECCKFESYVQQAISSIENELSELKNKIEETKKEVETNYIPKSKLDELNTSIFGNYEALCDMRDRLIKLEGKE